MSRRINFERIFFLGLFAFLRQVELSIDRREDDLHIKNYFSLLEGEFRAVEKALLKHTAFKKFSNEELNIFIEKCDSYIENARHEKYFLYEQEASIILYLLTQLEDLLVDVSKGECNLALNKIRLYLAYSYENISHRMTEKEEGNLRQVEHLNQNEILKTKSILELVGPWY